MQSKKGKWQPFDALEGYKEALKEAEYEVGKIPKPELSDFELDLLDINIDKAIKMQSKVNITYYKDGYIYRLNEQIFKLDIYKRSINVGSKMISMDDIIEINL